MDDKSARKTLDNRQTKAGSTEVSDVHDTQTTADDTEISEAQIRERAFEIYLERGGVVCNAEKLIHFTAVKMSHSGLVLSSLFFEVLNV